MEMVIFSNVVYVARMVVLLELQGSKDMSGLLGPGCGRYAAII